MARWGLVIDLDRCTGCQACVVACKHENNLPFSTPETTDAGRLMTWIQLVPVDLPGRPAASALPLMCQHCDRPPCVDVCPTSATYINPEGIVAQIYPRCIGCRYCTNACPYAVKVFNWTEPAWPESMAAMHNPDVSVRPKGRRREVHVLPSPADRRARAGARRAASWRRRTTCRRAPRSVRRRRWCSAISAIRTATSRRSPAGPARSSGWKNSVRNPK